MVPGRDRQLRLACGQALVSSASRSVMTLSLTPNRARAKLRANELVKLYVAGRFASSRQVDFVCRLGSFDALCFDLEHFATPTQTLAELNLVARAFPVTTLARVRASDYQTVMRVLETSVGGIICSQVSSAAEARQIVQWSKFNNPKPAPGEVTGLRGWNGGNIDASYAMVPALDYIRHQNTQTLLIAEVGTEAAVQDAAAIAAVPGIDALYFAPVNQADDAHVHAGMARVAQAAGAAGKAWGTAVTDADDLRRAYSQGARLICGGGDGEVMQRGLRELAKAFGGLPAKINGSAVHAPAR